MRIRPSRVPALLAFIAALLPASGFAAGLITSSLPEQGATVVGRKPAIAISFSTAIEPGSLVAMLDGADITQVATMKPQGLEYVPVVALPPGAHELSVTARDATGAEIGGTLTFSSRHSRLFEEVGSENELGLSYEHAVREADAQLTAPDAKFEGNLALDLKGREGGLSLIGSANLAYFKLQPATPTDDGADLFPPEEEVNLMEYQLSAAYQWDDAGVAAEVGTLQFDQTPRTVSGLSRRGTRLSFRSGGFDAGAFMLKGESTIELDDPAGIGGTEDHLYGFTAGLRLFGGGATLKGIYLKGGETGDSPGISGGTGREGEVYGAVLATDLFQGRFTTEIEADFSKIETDPALEADSVSDEAYSLRAACAFGFFGCEAGYERRGRDFLPIGNLQLEPDREIARAGVSATLPSWRVALNAMRTADNVEDDPALSRVVSLQGTVEASYTGIPSAPFGLSYQQSLQESSRDPEGTLPVDLTTGTLSGWANLAWGALNLGLQASRSTLEDANPEGIDTTTSTYTITPSLALGTVTLTPSYTFTRTENEPAGTAADTQVAALDLRSSFFDRRIACDLAGSWSSNQDDAGQLDTRSLDASARIAYQFAPLRSWPARGSLGVKGVYTRSEDRLNGPERDDLAVYVVVTAAIPLSF